MGNKAPLMLREVFEILSRLTGIEGSLRSSSHDSRFSPWPTSTYGFPTSPASRRAFRWKA